MAEVWKLLEAAGQFLPWALVGALVTKVFDWVQGRKQLRATRSSLAVLVVEEFVQIRDILARKAEFGGLMHLLSFDVMVQRGGFEKLDLAVVTRMVELFRLLGDIFHLEQEVKLLQARNQAGATRPGAVIEIRGEIEQKRKEVLEKVTAFLLLIWNKECRSLNQRTRLEVAKRLAAAGLDLHVVQ